MKLLRSTAFFELSLFDHQLHDDRPGLIQLVSFSARRESEVIDDVGLDQFRGTVGDDDHAPWQRPRKRG